MSSFTDIINKRKQQNTLNVKPSEESFADRFSKQSKTEAQNLKDSDDQSEDAESTAKYVDPQKRALAELIYLVKGIDAGRNAWYYVLVERLKVSMFLKALNDDIIHLENYGKILFSGYGDEPPADITFQLKEEYGIK